MTPFVAPLADAHSGIVDPQALADVLNANFEELEDILGAVVTGLTPRGSWSATGPFPPDAARGDFWIVDRAGTVDGQPFAVGDWLIALDSPASPDTFEGQWARGDYSRVTRRDYPDPAALLASLEGPRGPGALWRAGPHTYRELLPDAPDAHVTTAGGQGLHVLPDPDGAMNLAAWGADLSGTVPAHDTLQAVIDLGTRAVRIPAGATIRLGGDVALRSGLDLLAQGATLASDGPARSLLARGFALGSSAPLAGDARKGEPSARTAARGAFAPGDHVVLVNSPDVDNDDGPKGQASQLLQVTAVDPSDPGSDRLTFDRALGFRFTAEGVATPATVHAVVPLRSLSVHVGRLRGVVVVPRLVQGFAFSCDDADDAGALQPDPTVPSANRHGRIRARVAATVGAASGPNALVDLRSWDDLHLDIDTHGGREDGTRLYACLDVRGTVRASGHGSRGVHAYKASGRDLSLAAENGLATGNVEQVLLDHCEDLDCAPRALGFRSGNGIEVRGRALRVLLREPQALSHPEAAVQACINLHPASRAAAATFEVRIEGGLVRGFAGYGIFAPDGCESLVIDGTTLAGWGGGVWNPLTVSTDAGIAAPRNVLVRNVAADGPLAFGCTPDLRGRNLRVEGSRMTVPEGGSVQIATNWDGVTLDGLRIESAARGLELRILDSTDVEVTRTPRPDGQARWSFRGSTLAAFDDPSPEDAPALEVALATNARLLDAFADPDGTPLAGHLPDAGPAWQASGGATIQGNALHLNEDGATALQRLPADAFTADLALLRPGGGTDHSFVWDWTDAANHSEVRFRPADALIEVADVTEGRRTVRAALDAWAIAEGETHRVRLHVRGHRVAVELGGARVLTATLARATGSPLGGWRRNAGGGPGLSSILVRP